MKIKKGDIFYVANTHKYTIARVIIVGHIKKADVVLVQTYMNDTDLNPLVLEIHLSNVSTSFFKTISEAKAYLGLTLFKKFKDKLNNNEYINTSIGYNQVMLCPKTIRSLIEYAEELYPEKMI